MDSIEKLSIVSMACTIVLRPPGAFLPPDCGFKKQEEKVVGEQEK